MSMNVDTTYPWVMLVYKCPTVSGCKFARAMRALRFLKVPVPRGMIERDFSIIFGVESLSNKICSQRSFYGITQRKSSERVAQKFFVYQSCARVPA